ncbi:hypothetical protein FT663_00733 [Candidozyma haemuli var. vulneris]|uniref:Rxt3-domain-containing protein n=1 Tax=Candidozyma haemuli TaxID=45357 RepID=A0A2V1AQ25_9ASCO|nr:hypothetical protein CXQ85_003672 [[Candida] haemuloni]KAF3992453.1 hypothetical protein FT662_01162 [[Candida] haemuloni var. vulneris]KAF3995190.1 hypothetical protein FT663_00733 [[Candida] haemuloni var. vulneris]PVH19814.1 hypothetical protein CXQ85_003672 [[Candida] haemuloni]
MSNSTPPTSGHEEKYGAKPSSGGIKLPSIAFLSNQNDGFPPMPPQDKPFHSNPEANAPQPPQPPQSAISRPMSSTDHLPSGTPPSMTINNPHESEPHHHESSQSVTPTGVNHSPGHPHSEGLPKHVHRSYDRQHNPNPHHHHHVRRVSSGHVHSHAHHGHAHGHHHHHHHHHHHRNPTPALNQVQQAAEMLADESPKPKEKTPEKELSKSAEPETTVTVTEKKAIPFVLDKGPLEELLREVFPKRRHLGSIVYNPTTTWASLQVQDLHFDEHDKQHLLDIQRKYVERANEPYYHEEPEYIPSLPPLTEACINSFVEVKIPYKFVKEFLENCTTEKVQRKRELWGGAGGIYTDDSDILAVLKHLGVFDDNADLSEINGNWKKQEIVKPLVVHKDADGVELLDLSVTLLLLPTLKQYYGFYKNGLNARSWLGDEPHSGLSYGVWSVKWETYNAFAGDKYIRKRAQREFEEDREIQKGIVEKGRGWRFDYKCYRELKTKFTKLDAGKNSTQEKP